MDWAELSLAIILDNLGEEIDVPFTAEELVPSIVEEVKDGPETLDTGVEEKDIAPLLARLQQEFFREWKRKYPNDSVKYKTWAEWSGKSEPPPPPETCLGRSNRPAYARDHLWLSWKSKEGMTPATIRDRWNAMTDEERRAICPRKWQRLESAGGSEGDRDLIEKALAGAEAEQQATGEN
jgi:hypothetical protein